MKATELRIGNWYISTKFQCPVICEMGDFYEIYARADGSSEYNVDDIFEPIPLNEEWLLKFGFERTEIQTKITATESGYYKGILMMVKYDKDSWVACPYGYPMHPNKSTYVHQLQNLYFVLTGEELEIKEK